MRRPSSSSTSLAAVLVLCGWCFLAGCSSVPTAGAAPGTAAAEVAVEGTLERDPPALGVSHAGPADGAAALVAQAGLGGWHAVPLPGKAHTRYETAHKEGRRCVMATSEQSASMWRRKLRVQPAALGEVSFSWWAQDLIEQGSVADAEREDSAARVMFGFAGDTGRLSMKNRMLFELAEALTGEAPPFATLMYVWDAQAPVGTVIVNPRTDRIRKIVVDSGHASLRRWQDHRRNLREDYRRAFGEDPGPLVSVAYMTDSDNTRAQARTWYGEVTLHPTAEAKGGAEGLLGAR